MLDIARRFAAYIPVTLVQQILKKGLPEPGQPRQLLAATMFADISGFTNMSEELASDGSRGAEELNRVLLTTFTAMIDVIHEMGGAVSHFYGDAMSIYFPETKTGDAAQRALACGQLMQKVMVVSFERVTTNRPPGKNPHFPLTIKIGVGYGRCQEIVVGDAAATLEFVLTGTAVDEAATAEKTAQSGQVVASANVLAQAGLPLLCATQAYCLVTQAVPMPSPRPILNWSAYDEAALAALTEAVAPFIPHTIAQRLEQGGSGEIAEHRPVTSLFVDFAFAGDIDEASDVETAVHGQLLHDYYQWAAHTVARFGGENARVNRILTGDKGNQLHIIFGAPVAPDSPDQAIRCAMTLVREKPEFIATQRIGLTAGKVFAGPVGSDARREYTVVGDMVNLSARLAQICHDNCIFTNSITAGRVENWIDFEVLPPVLLKGKHEAVSPYRPLGEHTGLTQLQVYFTHWERPLVGRATELDLLLGGMDAALHKIGGVAAILGSVGVGKTRLLAEGIRHWLDKGGTGVVGVAQQHTSDVPYAPWLNIWRDFFNLRVDMSIAVQAAHVMAQTKALLPDVGDDMALWGDVLGLPIPGQEHLLELSAEVKQARFFSLVRRCFLAYAELSPLLVIVEDAHWADRSSLALLDEVTKNLDGHALFFTVTFRLVEELNMEMLNRASCVPILLADLSPTHARAMLTYLVGVAQLPLSVEQHLGLRDREGRDSPVSPLFLEESVNMMIGAGVLKISDQVHVNEELLQTLQIPDTIHGLLLARLDRLPPAGRDLLQVASVIGRQFALEPLHNIAADIPEQQISSLLEDLSSEDITRLVTSDPEWIYLFQHALTHEVAYESMPYARRQALHQAMADWLLKQNEANLRPYYSILAYHYSQAGNHEGGLKYALAAGLDARDLFSNQEALEFFNLAEKHLLALGEEEHWETAVSLYLARAEVLVFTGDFKLAVSNSERSLTISKQHKILSYEIRTLNLLAELNYRQSNHEEAISFAKQVINKQLDQILSDELARSHHWLGMSATALFDYDLALTNLKEAEWICIETNNRKRLALVLEGLAYVHYYQRDLVAALDAMERGLALSKNVSVVTNIVSAMNNIALIQFMLGKAIDALSTYNQAIELLEDASHNFLAHIRVNRGTVFSYLGYFSNANQDFEAAYSYFDDMGDTYGLVETFLAWGYEYYAPLKEWHLASNCYEQAGFQIDKKPEVFFEAKVRLLLARGQAALENGSLQKAEEDLEEAANYANEKSLTWWLSAISFYQGYILISQKKFKQAKDHLLNVLGLVEMGACPDYLVLALRELAKLESDKNKKIEYAIKCGEVALDRGRFLDRLDSLKTAGLILQELGHVKGEEYHIIADRFHHDLKKGNI